jgi:hypothetical protein
MLRWCLCCRECGFQPRLDDRRWSGRSAYDEEIRDTETDHDLCFCTLPAARWSDAQQEQEPQRPYVYGIYFECDVARQGLADEIFELAYLPAFEAAVGDGTITSFGWLAHHTGAKWRRVLYHSAPDMGSLFAALEKVNGAIDEKYPELGRAFSEVCGTHEDYIWQGLAGSRAPTSLSRAASSGSRCTCSAT